VLDAGIIRHRGKIEAIIGNARAFLPWNKMANLSRLSGRLSITNRKLPRPPHSVISHLNARLRRAVKSVKKRGFKFVGTTICYSFMQACGLVNDHITDCFCHPEAGMIRKWHSKDYLLC
jgi:DNA-3-methyladenine glycosylase I